MFILKVCALACDMCCICAAYVLHMMYVPLCAAHVSHMIYVPHMCRI
jgi:hypothetical protein